LADYIFVLIPVLIVDERLILKFKLKKMILSIGAGLVIISRINLQNGTGTYITEVFI
jgi:hypothetical protein